jgi:hypothetical protein
MLNKPNKQLKLKEKHLNRAKMHHNGLIESVDDVNDKLVVKQTNSKATTSSSNLLKKKSNKYIPTGKRACSTVVGTSLQLAYFEQKRWVRLTSPL